MCGFPTTCLEIQLLALVGLDVVVSHGDVDGDSYSDGDHDSNIDYDDDMMLEALLTKLFQEFGPYQ